MIYCHFCGAQLEDGMRFCPECGTKLIEENSSSHQRSFSSPSRHVARTASDDCYEASVQEEIETLLNELGDQRPSLKRINYDASVNYYDELDRLVGLNNVKQQIADHITDIKIQRQRLKLYPDLKINPSFNCIFKGKPGTGKTTVARLVSGILKQERLVTSGCYVEVDASMLISGWVGFSAKIARLAALEAFGGVLFIDEAYALMNASGSKSNPGKDVIDALTPLMENYRDKLIVILAGYDKEMDAFLASSNTGFPSRFRNVFHFDDYNAEEMYAIFEDFAEAEHYKLSEDAEVRLQTLLNFIDERKESITSFANARTVRQIYETVRARASRRMARLHNPDLTSITKEDVSLTREELACLLGKF